MGKEVWEKAYALLEAYREGKLSRRHVLSGLVRLGLGTVAAQRFLEVWAQGKLLPSAPEAPYEAPVTPERVAFLRKKPYQGVTINILILKATVGDAVKYMAPLWEKETGGKVNLAEVPIETLYQQIFTDLTTGIRRYDAYMTGAWFYGDFFTTDPPYINPIDDFLKDPRYPYWDPKEMLPPIRQLYTWKGQTYGTLFDADCQVLYFREDILTNKDYQRRFKEKMGYDLPVPPRTMKEMHDIADFFTGWDWNGDGQPDWGIALHAKVNEQGFFHFLTLAAPYVISKDNPRVFWFNPDTMEPLVNSDGHVKALEEYALFMRNGPRDMLGWTLGEGWNLFLSGRSVMEPTWGDLPTLAQDPKASKVKGKVGAAPIPGTTEAYDPLAKTWRKYSLNRAGNVNGGSWHMVISRFSKNKEATYDFLAFMANRKNYFFLITHGWTGVQPGVKYAFFPPYGTGSVGEWEAQGWDRHDAIAFTRAYYENLTLPLQEPYLRIPGAAEYWHELDVQVSNVLAGNKKAKEALDEVYAAWQKITDRYGRDKQLKVYRASLGLK